MVFALANVIGRRAIKKEVLTALRAGDLKRLDGYEPKKVLPGLTAALVSNDQAVKWRAVRSIGRAVARLAEEDLDAAREVCRRFHWNLNDESGTSGFGWAEALGEVLANHPTLAQEFSAILVFLLRDDPGSPDFEPLMEGRLWAVGRMAQVDPEYALGAGQHLARFVTSGRSRLRGLAVWVAGLSRAREVRDELIRLQADQTEVVLNLGHETEATTIGLLAARAVKQMPSA